MIDPSLRSLVRERAGEVCEYCRLPQASSSYVRFQIEHIIAIQHRGSDEAGNLAFACGYCNRHKGPNIAGIDPETGQLSPLFHPRQVTWGQHFKWDGTTIVGTTPVGRATVAVLGMNDWQRVELRENLQSLNEPFAG
jgi:hypothetical protein